jgi:Fungal N-terminal domain of STAND proteins
MDAYAALAAALENCRNACKTFQAKLKKWMRHSTDQHLHWWDRVRMGILADNTVETLSKRLLQCKVIINTAIGTMTLFVYLDTWFQGKSLFRY